MFFYLLFLWLQGKIADAFKQLTKRNWNTAQVLKFSGHIFLGLVFRGNCEWNNINPEIIRRFFIFIRNRIIAIILGVFFYFLIMAFHTPLSAIWDRLSKKVQFRLEVTAFIFWCLFVFWFVGLNSVVAVAIRVYTTGRVV